MEIRPEPVVARAAGQGSAADLPAGRARRRTWSFAIDIAPGMPGDDRDRRAAARAGAEESAVERVQVHRSGQGRAERSGASGDGQIALRVDRHRHRHFRGPAAERVRGLSPGRRHDQPQIRRHRPRAFDLARACAPARRRHRAAEAARARAARSRSSFPKPTTRRRCRRASRASSIPADPVVQRPSRRAARARPRWRRSRTTATR